MSKTGSKAMAQLRDRLDRLRSPDDKIILRRDLVAALVFDIDILTHELRGITCPFCERPKFGDRGGDSRCENWHNPYIQSRMCVIGQECCCPRTDASYCGKCPCCKANGLMEEDDGIGFIDPQDTML